MPNIRGTFVTKFVAENFPNSANHVTLLNNTSSNEQTKFQVLLKTKKLFLKNFKTGGGWAGKQLADHKSVSLNFFDKDRKPFDVFLRFLCPLVDASSREKDYQLF